MQIKHAQQAAGNKMLIVVVLTVPALALIPASSLRFTFRLGCRAMLQPGCHSLPQAASAPGGSQGHSSIGQNLNQISPGIGAVLVIQALPQSL